MVSRVFLRRRLGDLRPLMNREPGINSHVAAGGRGVMQAVAGREGRAEGSAGMYSMAELWLREWSCEVDLNVQFFDHVKPSYNEYYICTNGIYVYVYMYIHTNKHTILCLYVSVGVCVHPNTHRKGKWTNTKKRSTRGAETRQPRLTAHEFLK